MWLSFLLFNSPTFRCISCSNRRIVMGGTLLILWPYLSSKQYFGIVPSSSVSNPDIALQLLKRFSRTARNSPGKHELKKRNATKTFHMQANLGIKWISFGIERNGEQHGEDWSFTPLLRLHTFINTLICWHIWMRSCTVKAKDGYWRISQEGPKP